MRSPMFEPRANEDLRAQDDPLARSRRNRTPAEAMSAATGGRSLRTDTVTASTAGMLEDSRRDRFGESLEQAVTVLAHDRHGRVHDEGVVDGLGQVVFASGLLEISFDLQIDFEGLRSVLLALERTMATEHADSS